MSRFLKVFLREPVDAGIQLAAFGKHPAWDDHLDDIGLNTKSLALTKQLIYSEGIVAQLASGAWDQLEKSGHAIEFDHRFVWSRDQQSIAGAIWASTDRKRRTRFPLIICAQAGLDGPRASALLLDYVGQLGGLCRTAKTQEEFLSAFGQAQSELLRATLPSAVANLFSEITDLQENSILPSLVTLSAGLKSKLPRGPLETAKASGARFRLAAISSQTKDNLSFWSACLATQCAGSSLPHLVIAANGRRWIDLIVGEPRPNDFFCLRANENALPTSRAEIEETQARKLESAAKEYLRIYKSGCADAHPHRRTWWSGLFNK
jgi:hypothetical protein